MSAELSLADGVLIFGDKDVLGTGSYSQDPTTGATLSGLQTGQVTFGAPATYHSYPFDPDPTDYPGTDQIFTGSNQTGFHDGYSVYANRARGPQVITLDYSSLIPAGSQIDTFTLGIAADDFQFPVWRQPFVASINGTINAALKSTLNSLVQTGPQVQFFSIGLDPASLNASNVLTLTIDNSGDGGDGWAVDFLTVGVQTSGRVCQKKLAMMENAYFAGSEAGLYTINADGSGLTKLLSVPPSPHGGSIPRWSPDETKIAFDAEFGGNDEIYVINQDGTGLQQLTFDPAGDRDPVWSPDGTKIVFDSNRGMSQDLFVMNADGSNIANLTNSPNSDEYADDWSPDGTQIVFDSYASGLPQDLWIMNADGSGQTDLTPHTEGYADGGGRWSPDGTKLIFGSSRIGNGDIFMMNPNGTAVTDLTNRPAYDYSDTVWSHPDGVIEIAFTRRLQDGTNGVYTMNGNGTNQRAIFLPNTQDNLLLDARRR